MEQWKEIEGYNGDYTVSNYGNLKCKNFKNVEGSERITKQTKNGLGYVYVGLKGKAIPIHILVAKAFPEICGEWFENADVHHKDFDRTNNNANNLQVITKKEHHRLHLNRNNKEQIKKTIEVLSKPVIQYTLDGEFVAEYPSAKEAERQTNIKQSNISNCCIGAIRKGYKVKTAGGYKWSFKYGQQ